MGMGNGKFALPGGSSVLSSFHNSSPSGDFAAAALSCEVSLPHGGASFLPFIKTGFVRSLQESPELTRRVLELVGKGVRECGRVEIARHGYGYAYEYGDGDGYEDDEGRGEKDKDKDKDEDEDKSKVKVPVPPAFLHPTSSQSSSGSSSSSSSRRPPSRRGVSGGGGGAKTPPPPLSSSSSSSQRPPPPGVIGVSAEGGDLRYSSWLTNAVITAVENRRVDRRRRRRRRRQQGQGQEVEAEAEAEVEVEEEIVQLFRHWSLGCLSPSMPFRMIAFQHCSGLLSLRPLVVRVILGPTSPPSHPAHHRHDAHGDMGVARRFFGSLGERAARRTWAERAARPVYSKYAQSIVELYVAFVNAVGRWKERCCEVEVKKMEEEEEEEEEGAGDGAGGTGGEERTAEKLRARLNSRLDSLLGVHGSRSHERRSIWEDPSSGRWETWEGTIEVRAAEVPVAEEAGAGAEEAVRRREKDRKEREDGEALRRMTDEGNGPPRVDVGCFVLRGRDFCDADGGDGDGPGRLDLPSAPMRLACDAGSGSEAPAWTPTIVLVPLVLGPPVIAAVLREPEPMDPDGSPELISAYGAHRRARIRGLFWLCIVMVTVCSALAVVQGYQLASDRALGLAGGVAGKDVEFVVAHSTTRSASVWARGRAAKERADSTRWKTADPGADASI